MLLRGASDGRNRMAAARARADTGAEPSSQEGMLLGIVRPLSITVTTASMPAPWHGFPTHVKPTANTCKNGEAKKWQACMLEKYSRNCHLRKSSEGIGPTGISTGPAQRSDRHFLEIEIVSQNRMMHQDQH